MKELTPQKDKSGLAKLKGHKEATILWKNVDAARTFHLIWSELFDLVLKYLKAWNVNIAVNRAPLGDPTIRNFSNSLHSRSTQQRLVSYILLSLFII